LKYAFLAIASSCDTVFWQLSELKRGRTSPIDEDSDGGKCNEWKPRSRRIYN
jgi:hypothetical protein